MPSLSLTPHQHHVLVNVIRETIQHYNTNVAIAEEIFGAENIDQIENVDIMRSRIVALVDIVDNIQED